MNRILITLCAAVFGLSVAASAGTLTDKLKSDEAVINHGNYCGPGWSDGTWTNSSTDKAVCTVGTTLVAPIDATDALCMAHDRAYCTTDPAQKDSADAQLIAGLKALKPGLQQEWKDQGCAGVKAPDSNYKSCMSLKNQIVYDDAAIAAFTAKRALYKKNIKSVADAKSKLQETKTDVSKKSSDPVAGDGKVAPFRW